MGKPYSSSLINFVTATIMYDSNGLPDHVTLEDAAYDIAEWKREDYEDLPEDLTPESFCEIANHIIAEEKRKHPKDGKHWEFIDIDACTYRIDGTYYMYSRDLNDVYFSCRSEKPYPWMRNDEFTIRQCKRFCPRCFTCSYIKDAAEALEMIRSIQ